MCKKWSHSVFKLYVRKTTFFLIDENAYLSIDSLHCIAAWHISLTWVIDNAFWRLSQKSSSNGEVISVVLTSRSIISVQRSSFRLSLFFLNFSVDHVFQIKHGIQLLVSLFLYNVMRKCHLKFFIQSNNYRKCSDLLYRLC